MSETPERPDPLSIDQAAEAQWKKIGERIEGAQEKLSPKQQGVAGDINRSSSLAWRVLIDIISAPAVGLLIGYFLDRWLGMSPLFILLCFFLGMGGGFLNAYRTAMGKGAAVGFKKDAGQVGKQK